MQQRDHGKETAARIAEETASLCEQAQRLHIDAATEYGYTKDLMLDFAQKFREQSDDTLVSQVRPSFEKFRAFVKARTTDLTSPEVTSYAYALGTATVSTGVAQPTTNSWLRMEDLRPPPGDLSNPASRISVALEKLDPVLASTFKGVWESFDSGKEDGVRSALFQMRQTLDHIGSALAPDKLVRESKYFKLKTDPNKSDQVHRKERWQYLLNSRKLPESGADFIAEQVDLVVKNYERLNKLHDRSQLDRKDVRALLVSLEQSILLLLD